MATPKANVLLVGGGAVGSIAAVNIETGGLGAVTIVARSNYARVTEFGYDIESVDHGKLQGWRPTTITNRVPDVLKTSLLFDYLICTTKNCPDIEPTIPTIIGPGVTPGHTVIILIQNGLNIEKPLLEAFPQNVVLSGISMIDCHEAEQGHIIQDFPETLLLGPFRNPNINLEREKSAAQAFITMYAASGKTRCLHCEDVPLARWKKLAFNACFNPICAITGLDVARARLADGAVEGLLRPAMVEIIATANALGHIIPEEEQIASVLNYGTANSYLKPSMQTDAEKGNYIEYENLVGEPLREAQRIGLDTPILKTIYELCRMIQWRTKEVKGLVKLPPKRVLRRNTSSKLDHDQPDAMQVKRFAPLLRRPS